MLLVALLVGCSVPSPTPSPAVLRQGTPPPTTPLTSSPPAAVQSALYEQARIEFLPLTDALRFSVRVTAAEAERTGLADAGIGYGPDGGRIVWKKVGCVFLGLYTAPRMPNHGQTYVPDTFPAYLVQVLAKPVPDFPLANIGVVVVDATTGARRTAFGGGEPPSGIMGTTCGVAP